MIDFDTEEEEVGEIKSKISHLEKSLVDEQSALEKSTKRLARARDAQEILQMLAKAVQQKAHERISEVVTSCLAAVFDDPYEFKIVFETKRGKTEAHLRFLRRELEVDPLTASGGGMIDVAAFALRVSCLVLHRPKLSRLLVLDEPFRFVSAQYQDNVRTMMEDLSAEMKIQIILVTHNPAYETGQIIHLD